MPLFSPGRSYFYSGQLTPELAKQHQVEAIDIIQAPLADIGVKELRSLLAQAQQRPFGQCRLLWLDMTETISEVIQNTLLKLLEEPPDSLIVVLRGDRFDTLLPTVRSRLHVVAFVSEKAEVSYRPVDLAGQLPLIKDRSLLVKLISDELANATVLFLDQPSNTLRRYIEALERSLNRLRQNANQKLVTDWLLLHLPSDSGNG